MSRESRAALANLRKRFHEWENEVGEPIYVIEAVSRYLAALKRPKDQALSPSKGEREDIPDSDNQLTEELRQAIEDEANRQPATWDWYDLARAATQRIRRLKRAR